jgi:hypothetical protein
MKAIPDRICLVCGSEFKNSGSFKKKYCSKICRGIARRRSAFGVDTHADLEKGTVFGRADTWQSARSLIRRNAAEVVLRI